MCLSIAIERPDDVLCHKTHRGYEFMVTHNTTGYRCGYVRLPKGHPWHGQDFAEIDANVHGGLTFAEPDVKCDKPGEDDAFWIGFDCAHADDKPDPGLPQSDLGMSQKFWGTVRTQEYVEAECCNLIDQAIDTLY